MPFGWHQDNGCGELEPYNALSSLTALDDCDKENGCLWIIPGSHREGQVDVRRTDKEMKARAEIVVQVDESRAIPLPMKAGEAIMFHCWMLHKSTGNTSETRDRRILYLRYADADAVEVYNDRRPRLGRFDHPPIFVPGRGRESGLSNSAVFWRHRRSRKNTTGRNRSRGLVIQDTVDTVVVVIQFPAIDHPMGFRQA